VCYCPLGSIGQQDASQYPQAVLAFIPLTFSASWGSLTYTLIGGTAVGTVLALVFLPALYSSWFKVKPAVRAKNEAEQLVHLKSPLPEQGGRIRDHG
jgi:hypothetical protein